MITHRETGYFTQLPGGGRAVIKKGPKIIRLKKRRRRTGGYAGTDIVTADSELITADNELISIDQDDE